MVDIIKGKCGTDCATCSFKEKTNCKGCLEMDGILFWGECDIYKCAANKGFHHCGDCQELPCKDLIRFIENGHNPDRLTNLNMWKNESYGIGHSFSLFPLFPNLGLVPDGCLPPVAHDRRFHQRAVLEQLFLLVLVVCKVGERSIALALFVNERVQPADRFQNTVQLAPGHALLRKVDHLELDAALFEPALRLFGIKAFVFAENLYIHAIVLLLSHYSKARVQKQALTKYLHYCIMYIEQ